MSEEEFICPQCGETFTHAGYLKLHVERKHGPERQTAPVSNRTDEHDKALIPGWRQNPNLSGVGLRSITMLRPICRSCQYAENAPRDWYRSCRHEPYVTIVEEKEDVPEMTDELVDGVPTGRRIIGKITQVVTYHPQPNATKRELMVSSNSNQGVNIARAKGCIFPSQLRSKYYPNGIADTCEFVGCFKQTDLKVYEMQTEVGMQVMGRYCRRDEAALVWQVMTEKVQEVGQWSPEARQARTQMLAASQIQVVSA